MELRTLVLMAYVNVAQMTRVATQEKPVSPEHVCVELPQVVLVKHLVLIVMLPIMFVNVHQLWLLAVELLIHVLVAYVSVAQMMRVAMTEKPVSQAPVCVELLRLV